LDHRFEKLRDASHQLRATFRPFLADLKNLRDALESDSTSLRIAAKITLIDKIKAQGQQVQACLKAVMAELNATAALLTPSNASSH